MFRRRRLRYYHFLIALTLLALAIWLNIEYYFNDSAICYANSTGVCSSIFTFIVVEILAYTSILIFGLYVIYLIIIRERVHKEEQIAKEEHDAYVQRNVVVRTPKAPCEHRVKTNSINYSIDRDEPLRVRKPKFEDLVVYISDFPYVTSKTDDQKITFYFSGKPFVILVNHGYYFPMIFKQTQKDGMQLVRKYSIIKKQLSDKNDTWYIAENYNGLPKEIVFKIVKRSYDLSKKN